MQKPTPETTATLDRYACQECGEPWIFEGGAKIVESAGSGFNASEGQTEYWWEGFIVCPKCGHKNPWSDSSL